MSSEVRSQVQKGHHEQRSGKNTCVANGARKHQDAAGLDGARVSRGPLTSEEGGLWKPTFGTWLWLWVWLCWLFRRWLSVVVIVWFWG